MDNLTFEILRAAVTTAKSEQIESLDVLRPRIDQMYPNSAVERDAAIKAWASRVNFPPHAV